GHGEQRQGNAELFCNHWQQPLPEIERLLYVRPVMVFVVHMIDRPERASPRFPPEHERSVAERIEARIVQAKPGFGFSSAACGSDILFLEAMLKSGAEVSVAL